MSVSSATARVTGKLYIVISCVFPGQMSAEREGADTGDPDPAVTVGDTRKLELYN
jgi:hypothetical protein